MEVGTVQPLARISEIVRASGAALHLDMAQAPTAIDMNGVAELADTISLSAHKMYGPMGIGCLYVSRGHQSKLTPQIVGGGQQNGLRSGTVPVALAAGMGKAAEIVAEEAGERERLRRLNAMLWTALQALPCEVELNGPSLDARHPANLNVSFSGYDSRDFDWGTSASCSCVFGVCLHFRDGRAVLCHPRARALIGARLNLLYDSA